MSTTSIKFYEIPDSLGPEIDELEKLINDFRDGNINSTEIKARRVPFGVYEQRKDNTYMVRIRCTGGGITPAQFAAVADLSAKYGRESLHFTTRQELQIHNAELENIIVIIRELKKVGLASRGGGGNTVRNIMVSWDSGVSPDEIFDVAPYAVELTSRLIDESDSWSLPRKFKIAFSNSQSDNAQSVFNDIGFIARIKDGVKGFKVFVAGGMGSKPQVGKLLHDFIPADKTYLVAESVKNLFSKHGNRKNKHMARLRFLWRKLGREQFVEFYNKEFASLENQDIKPFTVTEIGHELPESIPLEPISIESDDFDLWKKRYVREQKQKGLNTILFPVFLGDLANEDAGKLAGFLNNFGDDVIRFTMQQNISIRNIPGEYLGNVFKVLTAISGRSDKPVFLSGAIACTGANTCKLGICLPHGALRAINRKLENSGIDLDTVEDVRMNISGCPNTCGQHLVADIGFYGRVARKDQVMYPAYSIVAGAVVGGENFRFARKVGDISARKLPDFVGDLLTAYSLKKENYSSFSAYIDDIGEAEIAAICKKYSDIPSFDEDKNYFFDWGADNVFSLVGRGVGECSAGLFDLIDVDRDRISELRKKVDEADGEKSAADILYHIVLSSSRMLLVTRGVEGSSDGKIFDAFTKHFIQAGLIDSGFEEIVNYAKNGDNSVLPELKIRVLALADAVEKLYNSMDNSLKFPADTVLRDEQAAEKASGKGDDDVLFRDYRGVACPMNFVKVKIDLANMASGDKLRIYLDDGAPIENVPRSVESEGHEIVSQDKNGDFWEVVIGKK